MTDKQAYEILSKVLDTINEDDYPEIHSIIFSSINESSMELFLKPYYIARELHEADATKKCLNVFPNFF